MSIMGHLHQHGKELCPKYRGSMADVELVCPGCHRPMDYHCCHFCCLECGRDMRGVSFGN